MSGKLLSALEQAVTAAKFERRDTRPPLQAGSYGNFGGSCSCYALAGQGWEEVRTVGCPIHGHLETVVVIPAQEWTALVNAVRDSA